MNSETKYIVNCVGQKVAAGDSLYSAKCWIGNTDDFLQDNDVFVIESCQEWEPPPYVVIMVPIYRSGRNYLPVIDNLLSIDWLEPIEILLYINQPPGELMNETKESLALAKELVEKRKQPDIHIRFVYEELCYGLAEVYRRAFTTTVKRIRQKYTYDPVMEREELLEVLTRDLLKTVYLVIDDDTRLKHKRQLQQAIQTARETHRPIIGDVEIEKVYAQTSQLGSVLKNIINVYFRFKSDLNSLILTPRGNQVGRMMQLDELQLDVEYADQIWFANLLLEKPAIKVSANSYIQEEEYPSNAKQLRDIQAYLLADGDESSLDMFTNLYPLYEDVSETIYSKSVVEMFCRSIISKDFDVINQHATQLLALQR